MMNRFIARHVVQTMRDSIRGKAILNDGRCMVFEIPKGHGRLFITENKGGSRMVVNMYAERCAVLGAGVDKQLAGEDVTNMVPIIGIRISSPESAEAWAQVFGDLANSLRKDAELEKGEDE